MQREMLKAWRSKAPEDSSDLLDAMEADNAFFFGVLGRLGAFIHCKQLNGRQSF